ncbi:unnamed protein product [Acanthoscelides obtectus]|uniref:Integrin alpha second immunoglobulin-like domain-containing protein n=2 Tax=Acanthoscelides obtectus TaxID=200917 RepID=A0A9P0NV84_ACAOB|nr:unnamed protein product [Acanthoscelides obtectus]CAK1672842.1 Integrin alpha-PS3 [Acanthoscelides obtectus]
MNHIIVRFASVLSLVASFNFDTDYPIIFFDPSNSSSYFGYTVALSPKWIKIGAPLSNRSGELYECTMTRGCKTLTLPNISMPSKYKNVIERHDRSWIGATMDVSYEFNRIVVCGFHKHFTKGENDFTMGGCYWSNLTSSSFENIYPILDFGKTIKNNQLYMYGHGEAGFSAHLTNGQNELILGAPGVYNWVGAPIRIQFNENQNMIDPEIPDVSNFDTSGYLGYSTDSGYFYGHPHLFYASGSPKGSGYKGKVIIFQIAGNNRKIDEREVLVGEQFGEYFGATLTSGELNRDRYTDLIVGAPFHKVTSFNEGCVYLFLGGQNKLRKATVLYGKTRNGMFGSALAFLGDIDNDGYGDVAIGAPNDAENSGVVYIFRGAKQENGQFGLNKKPSQTIIGSQIDPHIRGFGISFSKVADIDGNDKKDLAIGAHSSGHVVLLRALPTAVIKYTFRSIPDVLKGEPSDFTLQACFSYSEYTGGKLDIKYKISFDKSSKQAIVTKKMTLIKGRTICDKITRSTNDSLKVVFSYELVTPSSGRNGTTYISDRVIKDGDKLCIKCPVLDIYRSNSTLYKLDLPFALDCGDDDLCYAELQINVSFPGLRNETWVVGSSDNVTVQVEVSNIGENAYATKLEVALPDGISLRQIPPQCLHQTNSSFLVCNVDNPLKRGKQKIINLDLDIKNVDDYTTEQVDVTLRVNTTSNVTRGSIDGHHVYSFKLKRDADIMIYGISEQETNYFGSDREVIGITHIYKVEKIGSSSLESIQITLLIPISLTLSNQKINFMKVKKIQGKFSGQTFDCQHYHHNGTTNINSMRKSRNDNTVYLHCDTEDVLCEKYLCQFGPYRKQNNPATVKLQMNLDVSALNGILGSKQHLSFASRATVTIISPKFFIQTDNRTDSTTIVDVFVNDTTQTKKIGMWIIIASIFGGLTMLTALIIILYKCQFFERSKKQELKDLRAAIFQCRLYHN